MNAGRAVVSGMVCAHPRQGGATWAVLQFVLGLRRLGWEVHFVETLDHPSPESASYLADTMSAFGLEGAWTLLEPGATVPKRLTAGTDFLLNISGSLKDGDLMSGPALRVYVDLDPAFTQMWHEALGIDMGLDHHDRFVTVGQAIGQPGCPIPSCGKQWIGIAPPVVLQHWPVSTTPPRPEMTTVGHWRGYGSIDHGGVRYGQRAHTMRRLIRLPSMTEQSFLLAVAIDPGETADIDALAANGWRRIDPLTVAHDTTSYRRFVSGSRAEIGIPKSGYIDSRSGWFSDRSACYLASGRPVILASTGFEAYLPAGEGLLAFRDVEEAAEHVATVNADYARHSRAARRVAEEHLDSDLVLSRMIDAIGAREAARC
jgi:hypothetical protein